MLQLDSFCAKITWLLPNKSVYSCLTCLRWFVLVLHKLLKENIWIEIDLFNESFVDFISLHSLAFTDFVQKLESSVLASWSMNVLLSIMLIINIIPITIEFYNTLKVHVLRPSRLYCYLYIRKRTNDFPASRLTLIAEFF